MIFLEIAYFVIAYVSCVFFSGALAGWAIRIGAEGSTWSGRAAAFFWRLSVALFALAILYVLWVPILHVQIDNGFSVEPGTAALVLAILFTLLFGGNFVLGGAFAGVTSLLADQRGYLRELRAKRSIHGPSEKQEQIQTDWRLGTEGLPEPDVIRLESLGLSLRYPDGETGQRVDDIELACRQLLLNILDGELGPSDPNTGGEFLKGGIIAMAIGSNRHRTNLEVSLGILKSESAAKLVQSGRAEEVLMRQVKLTRS